MMMTESVDSGTDLARPRVGLDGRCRSRYADVLCSRHRLTRPLSRQLAGRASLKQDLELRTGER